MERKSLFKVTIYNEDRTSIHVIAKNKLDATFKYNEFMKQHYSKGFLDENQDFEIEFVDYAYE